MLLFLLACGSAPTSFTPEVTDRPEDTDADTDPVADTDLPVDTAVPTSSGCLVSSTEVVCPHQTTSIAGANGVDRDVHHAVPAGTPPAGGWPVALLFQGSFFPAETFFEGAEGDLFGGLYQARLTSLLLDAGYAVLAPNAHQNGTLFWDTNIPPWSGSWSGCPDDVFLTNIFAAIDAGTFGPLDSGSMVASGISSGGYMTSRMAVSYPGRFRALAIQSGSYATCGGSLCIVPELPADHPPTLFVHGRLDVVVPLFTTEPYRNRLADQGTAFDTRIDDTAGHNWFSGGPEAIVQWFQTH